MEALRALPSTWAASLSASRAIAWGFIMDYGKIFFLGEGEHQHRPWPRSLQSTREMLIVPNRLGPVQPHVPVPIRGAAGLPGMATHFRFDYLLTAS